MARVRPHRLTFAVALLLGAATVAASGCGFAVERRSVARLPTAPMRTATLTELVEDFNREANLVHSLQLKLDMKVSFGGPRSGTITTPNAAVTTFLLIEKPARVRIFGNVTILGRLFDMASDGTDFEVSVPPKSQFIIGRNDFIQAKPANAIEGMRPAVILDSMLINPIQLGNGEHVVSINDRAETFAEYGVMVYRPNPSGIDTPLRRIMFSRYDLLPSRQIIYDQNGFPATQVTYAKYILSGDVHMPTRITINRPNEEYTMDMTVHTDGIQINPAPRAPDTWRLTQPAGFKLIDLNPPATTPPGMSLK